MNLRRFTIYTLLLCLPYLASADVLVYRLLESHSVTGEGSRFRYRTAGYWVTDWDTGQVQTIKSFYILGDGFYEIEDPTVSLREYQAISLSSSRSVTSYTYTTRYEEFTSEGTFQELHTFLKGRDRLLSLSPWRQIIYPSGLSGRSQLMDFRESSTFATESRVKLLLDRRLTTTANINSVTLPQMIDTLAIILSEDGFTEITGE